MLPLTYANKNETNIIKKVSGKPEVRQHLADLGFVAGTPINVISDVNGALMVFHSHLKKPIVLLTAFSQSS